MAGTWSVGMALYDNPPHWVESTRATMTVQNILLGHPLVTEVVVVDNNPHAQHPFKEFAAKNPKVRYAEMPEPKGTAAPRNRVFELATNRRVACIDPHVGLYHGFFEALNEMYDGLGPDCPDLFHGPMMCDDLTTVYAHHLNDQWRAQMWGTWGWAWQKEEFLFSTLTTDGKDLRYVTLGTPGGQRELSVGEVRYNGLPDMPWPGHEDRLFGLGCSHPADPFLIPSHGMGFFACLKDKWLPFHKDCRGFGGEEMTTGYRFRRAGRNVWCVPGAKWWHHFYRANRGAVPYPLVKWDRIRNYVLEFRALGMDLAPIKDHFNPHGREWDQLLAGAEWPTGGGLPSRAEVLARTGGVPTGNTRTPGLVSGEKR